MRHSICKHKYDDFIYIVSLSFPDLWLWLLILLIIVLALVLLCICCLICAMRRRSRRKGRYGVKDVADGKEPPNDPHNRSDIHYSVDGAEDGLLGNEEGLDDTALSKAPIIKDGRKAKVVTATEGGKGKSSQSLEKDAVGGSENSLLNLTDEELWLRKGMDEDGSFREGRYAHQD